MKKDNVELSASKKKIFACHIKKITIWFIDTKTQNIICIFAILINYYPHILLLDKLILSFYSDMSKMLIYNFI